MAEIPFAIATTRAQAEAMLLHPERNLWDEIQDYEARHLDLVLMGNVRKRDFHLGTYIRDGARGGIMHITQANGVVYEMPAALKNSGFAYQKFFRRTRQ